MNMRAFEDLVDRETLENALHFEGKDSQDLLPPSRVDWVYRSRLAEVSGYLGGLYSTNEPTAVPEVIAAPKPNGGLRPITILPFQDRVLLRSLVDTLDAQLPRLRRSPMDAKYFKEALLNETDCTYITRADVSAFYQFVDHDLLVREIVHSTGRADIADRIAGLLGQLMGRRFGLPQNHHASDVLSELVIDIAERKLIRDGLRLTRYNDDFRVGADTKAEALRNVEHLDAEIRALGFALNEGKTVTTTRNEYAEWLTRLSRRFDELLEDAHVNLSSFDYGGGYIDADESEIAIAAGEGLIELWYEDKDAQSYADRIVARQFAELALEILGKAGSESALLRCKELVEHNPFLTQHVATYLSRLVEWPGAVTPELTATVTDLLTWDDAPPSDWTALWIFEAVLAWDEPIEAVGTSIRRWISASDSPQVVASGLLLLSKWNLIEAKELLSAAQTSTAASRPLLAAAGAVLGDALTPRQQRALFAGSPLNRMVFDAFRSGDVLRPGRWPFEVPHPQDPF